MNGAIFGLITFVTLLCCLLLARGYAKSRTRMLLWSALCFLGLSVASSVTLVDLLVLTAVDLRTWRLAITAGSLAALVYGFIWESS